MALKMIEDAEAKGLIKDGGTIIEGTSGNTGMGLALVLIHTKFFCILLPLHLPMSIEGRLQAKMVGRAEIERLKALVGEKGPQSPRPHRAGS